MTHERASHPSFSLGRAANDGIRFLSRRWAGVALFVGGYWALAEVDRLIALPMLAKLHGPVADAGPWVLFALFTALGWFRDGAVVALALQEPGSAARLRDAALAAMRSYPALLLYRAILIAPGIADAFAPRLTNLPPNDVLTWVLADSGLTIAYTFLIQIFWGLSEPAAIAERLGPLSCMRRSWRLLAHNRWRLFALLALTFGAAAIVGAGGAFVATMIGHGVGPAQFKNLFAVQRSATSLISSIIDATLSAMLASVFLQLGGKGTRHGSPQGLAEVFA